MNLMRTEEALEVLQPSITKLQAFAWTVNAPQKICHLIWQLISGQGRFCPTEDQSREDQFRWEVNVAREIEKESGRSRVWSILKTDTPPEKASSIKSAILYDCEAEALSNSIRPSLSYSPTIKWRCCPRLVQFHGFRSVEVLLDTPPGSP
ncbi:hypothetical protein F2Q70_00002379 [Brassica cretica]|uniref:Uncharacterized protein n=1 Tax=Brassica cretica TaxID=69181 RepID=A0A8S9IMK5_BRACR|nr:hypothetical protein F2Q70_00002379 [Brassica cretica]